METAQITLGNIEKTGKRMNDGITVLLLLRGRLNLKTGGSSRSLEKNDIIVLNPGDIYSLDSPRDNVVLFLFIPRQFLERQCPESLKYSYLCCSASGLAGREPLYSSIKKSVANLAFLYYKKEPGYEMKYQAVLFEILYILFQDFRQPLTSAPVNSGGSDIRLRSILAYIHQNYQYRISLEELAKQEFMSVQYLSKLFRQKMGVSFLEYINALRLQSAVSDLAYGTETITKIALNNGFASAKALNAQFRRQFHCSPLEYRKKSGIAASNPEKVELFQFDSEDSLKALVKFIDHCDQIQEDNALLPLTVDFSNLKTSPLPSFYKIAAVGDIQYILRSDTQSQLRLLQEQLKFDFVYLTDFLHFGSSQNSPNDTVLLYNYYEVFNTLREAALAPILSISLRELSEGFSSAKAGLDRLCSLFQILKRKYAPDYFRRWHVEILGSLPELVSLYPSVFQALSANCPDMLIGLRAPQISSAYDAALLTDLLAASNCHICEDAASAPPMNASFAIHFLTYTFDPNEESAPSDAAAFESFYQNYHNAATQSLRDMADSAGLKNLPLYLIEWNTLTGKSTVEAGEFHRSALIADTICSLMGHVSGIGFQLSLFNQPPITPELVTYPLSLFLYRNVKRPLFYILKSICSLYPNALWPYGNLLLTSGGQEHYALFMYNPCYMNPFQSLDNLRLKTRSQTVVLTFKNLKPGRYRIKKLLLDRDNGSLYHSWVRIDITVPLDEDDIDEYLENATTPSLALYERQIEDTCTIRQELTLNAVVLYSIKKLD